MFRIALCDDEAYFLQYEKRLIMDYMERRGYDYKIDSFSSGKELLERKDELQQYHILFLDIYMEEIDGMETARQIRRFSEHTYLVFVTAFITYAVDGYKVNASRFLLKLQGNLDLAMKECLDAILKEIAHSNWKHSFGFIEGNLEVRLEQIVYVESRLHKLIFHVKGMKHSKYTMYEKLDSVEALLGEDFCRIHKSYLVNLKYVYHMERYQLELYDGTCLSIAKGKYVDVNNRFLSYQGSM
ncbi:MAG: LytTR family DNA-binding domain-containing protein [Bacteroides sp.]|nr:LytTR family DNA-binding domain-containing protein [Bacteroides sp.]MCM1548711.1 LytTR family DNA-binding domain-containing protein [Clostridium sp.]